MDLPSSIRQVLRDMPDMAFAEDKSDYTRRVLVWAHENDISSADAVRCVNIRWKAWEVNRLLDRLENGDSGAIHQAVIMLLKDNYLP